MTDEEKKEYEELKSLLYTGTISQYGKRKLIDIIEKKSKEIERTNEILIWKQKHEEQLQKEIEELKDMNERQKYRIELVSEDKIEERGDSIDESTMLKQIKSKLDEKNIPIETLLAEFERLEDLEDDLTTVYLNGVYDGEKKVKDKIKAKIEKLNLKNEKLYEDNLTLAQEIKEFIEGTNDMKYYSTSFIKNHYISKDKIKAKIEESELLIDNSQGCMSDEDLYKEYGKIEFGQLLLEKE